jgi:hypothetical protein
MELPLAPRCPKKLTAPVDPLLTAKSGLGAIRRPGKHDMGMPPPSQLRHYRLKVEAQRRSALPTGFGNAFQSSVAQKTRKIRGLAVCGMLSSNTARRLIFTCIINILQGYIATAGDPSADNDCGAGMARCTKMTGFWRLSAA